MFDIKEEIKKLPHKPGVYIMKNKNDEIIYVGKAVVYVTNRAVPNGETIRAMLGTYCQRRLAACPNRPFLYALLYFLPPLSFILRASQA